MVKGRVDQEATALRVVLNQINDDGQVPKSEGEWKSDGVLKRYRQLWSQLHILEGVLYRVRKDVGDTEESVLVVPASCREDILRMSHDDPCSGHMGISRTLQRIKNKYYWPGWSQDVEKWVQACDKCSQRKMAVTATRAPLQNIEVSRPMQLWEIDILGPLPMTRNSNRYILVMTDNFTKWVKAVPIPDQRAETVARSFLKEVISNHGVPEYILSDQGRNFESDVMRKVLDMMGAKKIRTSAYHPQCDGQVERWNRTVCDILAAYVNEHHTDWEDYLPLAVLAY